jgi:hypothetical protein
MALPIESGHTKGIYKGAFIFLWTNTAGGADTAEEEIGCLKSLSAVLEIVVVGTPYPDEIVQGF